MAVRRNVQVENGENRKKRGWMYGILAASKMTWVVLMTGELREMTHGLPHPCTGLRSTCPSTDS